MNHKTKITLVYNYGSIALKCTFAIDQMETNAINESNCCGNKIHDESLYQNWVPVMKLKTSCLYTLCVR